MSNKTTLIFIAVSLFLILFLMIVYVFLWHERNFLNKNSVFNNNPNEKIVQKEYLNEEKEGNKTREITKIKNIFENDTLTKNISVLDNCDTSKKEEINRHEKEIKDGKIKTGEGIVSGKGSDYVEVNFRQDSLKWTSKVSVNLSTSIQIGDIDENFLRKGSMEDIEIGDTLIVRSDSASNILNSEFPASMIFVYH